MFKRNTLFIIGAGASREYSLPVGSELADVIARMFSSLPQSRDDDFRDSFYRYYSRKYADYWSAGEQIAKGVGLAGSIDNYIDAHRHDTKIAEAAKYAIVYAILRAERSSALYHKQPSGSDFNFSKLADTWLYQFGGMLTENVPLNEITGIFERTIIICFNYDRCIEHFLARWLSSLYNVDLEYATQIVGKLRILRPYGVVSPLLDPSCSAEFGSDPRHCRIGDLATNIRTYAEQVEDKSTLTEIRMAAQKADVIVILGFGFHTQNVDIIRPPAGAKTKRIIVSAFKLSDANKRSIYDLLRAFRGNKYKQEKGPPIVTLDDNSCGIVLRNNRRDVLSYDL